MQCSHVANAALATGPGGCMLHSPTAGDDLATAVGNPASGMDSASTS